MNIPEYRIEEGWLEIKTSPDSEWWRVGGPEQEAVAALLALDQTTRATILSIFVRNEL